MVSRTGRFYGDESWRTISVIKMGGEPYAYQQKERVAFGKARESFSRRSNEEFAPVVVQTDEHRMIPVSETVSEENTKELIEGFNTNPDKQ